VDGAPLHLVFPFVDGEKQGQANLTYSKTNEQHLLELHLDLDSLGPLRVKFLYEKTLSLTFYTSLDSSQQIIAQQLPELNERLTAAGLSMERLDVFKVAEKLLAIPLLPLSIESSTPTHLDTLA
jgi:hypothetical protein